MYLLFFFRLLLITLALIDDGKILSVDGYTWKLSCSLTILHHLLFLLLSYNYDGETLPFNKGSVYFTANTLAATDQLELLCCQSKIRSCGMTQFE